MTTQRTKSQRPDQRGGFQAAKEGWLKLCASYPNLSGSDYAVAIALSTYFNSKFGEAWPSIERLAADTNREPSTVWRSLKRLETKNLVSIVHGRGRHKVNRYRPKLGHTDADPKMFKRRTTARGKTLRTRNEIAANSQQEDCELAARTSEEPPMKCGVVGYQEQARINQTVPEQLRIAWTRCHYGGARPWLVRSAERVASPDHREKRTSGLP
jgi:DNA-binding transcriptional regulator YhcF (GntR family)